MEVKVCRRWTEEERNYVIENWGEKSLDYIAKKLNRTVKAIISFSEKNKLGSPYKRNYISTIEAANIIGVDQTTIIHWINAYNLKASFKALKSRKKYLIDIDDFRKFLKENQNLWKSNNLEEYALGKEESWLKEKRKRDSNIITEKLGSEWTIKEIHKMNKLIEEGKSLREIAEILNRTYKSVRAQRQRELNKRKKERAS